MNTIDIRKENTDVEAVRFSDDHLIEVGYFSRFSISDNNCEEVIDISYNEIPDMIKALEKVLEIKQNQIKKESG